MHREDEDACKPHLPWFAVLHPHVTIKLHVRRVAEEENEIKCGLCWVSIAKIALAFRNLNSNIGPIWSWLLVDKLQACHEQRAKAVTNSCLVGKQAVTAQKGNEVEVDEPIHVCHCSKDIEKLSLE